MRRPSKLRRQKPWPGGRLALPSCVIPRLRELVEKDARRFNCSKSFVIASILADFYGYAVKERYDEEPHDYKETSLAKVAHARRRPRYEEEAAARR